METFVAGQRWISDTDLQMGLGTVLASDARTVTLVFLASGETRIYAKQTAPLTRAAFACGDRVKSHQGWDLLIQSVSERDGLLTYHGVTDSGVETSLGEGELDNAIRLSRPSERLFTARVDSDDLFELRYRTRLHRQRLERSELFGLAGCRTSLLPHQLYIAHEVARRYAPRVLLADEVGLGKTIEAGLILHRQLLTGRARRVLIIVPDSLVHQWLVEMLRRFNLLFAIFDEERCEAIEADSVGDNPFLSEQLVLCSLDFVTAHPERHRQLMDSEWDLLVVDEAHHLQWSPQRAGREYLLVEALAAGAPGVLLLTATPEQLGKSGHFARLRLLDPDRFSDLEQFESGERDYRPIADAVHSLMTGDALTPAQQAQIGAYLDEADNRPLLACIESADAGTAAVEQARLELIEHLLDRHGTGRVMFRNTRSAIQGFAQRRAHFHPLPMPAEYTAAMPATAASGSDSAGILLAPERLLRRVSTDSAPAWTGFDPRVDWLIGKLGELRSEKILLITASARTVTELAQVLRERAGIHAAVFHEHMSLLERDRAAAFFADPDQGSQLLLCSEIGSEGRNFQFAHHLVLFDLPLDPDLLEQRIGRLDRIGQTQTIELHVPYLEGSPQAFMVAWYRDGLSAFERTCPAGHSVFAALRERLTVHLTAGARSTVEARALLDETRSLHRQLDSALQQGRDRLLEYNSCRTPAAQQLRDRIEQQEQRAELYDYVDALCDCYGVELREKAPAGFVLRGSEHTLETFPHLPEDGIGVTFDRATALANEDLQFLSWEHPLILDAMDNLVSSESGNSALTALSWNGVAPGSLLLECLYIVEAVASKRLQATRYLPATMIRIVIDADGNDIGDRLDHETVGRARSRVAAEAAAKIIHLKQQALRDMLANSARLAAHQAKGILANAHAQSEQALQSEINRLRALSRINPSVREEEIVFFQAQLEQLTQLIDSTETRLDAVRVLVTT